MSTNAAPLRSLTIDQTTAENGTPVLICRGRFVLETSNAFKTEVKKLSPDHKLVQADMSGVDYVDSAGLGSLLGIFVSAKSDGCHLELINVHPRVKDLLNMTRLTSILQADKG
ncbi:MAG TPA: STAS domain-containing protein [Candidatus Angelobacter sp.]|jgi:anti-anti-sigma factor|nr:STAS domain-containing protein [Candidatus Angelobacter sp.]